MSSLTQETERPLLLIIFTISFKDINGIIYHNHPHIFANVLQYIQPVLSPQYHRRYRII